MSEPTKAGREQFEAWLIQQKAVGEMIDAMWLAWQAGRESMRYKFDELDSLLRIYRHSTHGATCDCVECRKMLRDLIVIEQELDALPLAPGKESE